MSHMNYFEPYKSGERENNLTRAFLVLLRFSSTAFLMFYDAIRESCLDLGKKLGNYVKLPPTSILPVSAVEFDTQTSTISNKPIGSVLSVLLTDKPIEVDFRIETSNRKAIYDGIIKVGSELAIIIENKPDHANVWKEQLNPSEKSLPEDSTLISVPAVVEWKNIIKSLNQIRGMESIGGAEGLMIDDFLSFVNEHFPDLNPFDRLSLCGFDNKLIKSRIKELLKSIAVEQNSVRYNKKWGWYIDVGQPEIGSIGAIVSLLAEDSGSITVSLYFGDIQSQSQAFYRHNFEYEHIKKNLGPEWEVKPNFHVAFAQNVLLRLDCPDGRFKDYYDFWCRNVPLIKQHDRDDLLQLLKILESKELVIIDEEKHSMIESNVKAPNYKMFNICPSMGIHYKIPIERARELDERKELAGELYKRMKEGLNLVLSDVSQILKDPKK